jgi:hypothetical protein
MFKGDMIVSIEDNMFFLPFLYVFDLCVFVCIVCVKECSDTREETNVANKPTSFIQWNIPMLDEREHMQDMDTQGECFRIRC